MPAEMLGEFLAANWVWLLGALLTALLAYWWYEERQEAESPGDTVDRVTDRAEGATGGLLSGVRALLIGLLSIAVTVAMELTGLATDLNALLGGVPYFFGYVIYGVLSYFGVYLGLDRRSLGFLFILIFISAAFVKIGNTGSRRFA